MSDRIIPADFVGRALHLAARRGVDLSPALGAAGLDDAALADPMNRLSPGQVTSFVQATWALTGDELFGLGPGRVPRGTFRVLCLTLIHSDDLDGAFERMSEVLQVFPALPSLRIDRGVDTTRLSVVVSAHRHGAYDEYRVLSDFSLILLHRFAAWLIGRRVRLRSVELPYPQPVPELAADYDHIFGRPVTFDAAEPALELDNSVLTAPVVQTEGSLEEYLRRSPHRLLTERDYDSSATVQVRRVLELGMKGRTAGAEEIAEMLSISVPHLRRLLRGEGTSLGRLREEVLRDAAVAGLQRGESVDDLSRRLGFSEPSAFRRAFKRWTGNTPRHFRD
ncbi:AraC family transcriptional regulator [Rhodococcus rhodnii]|uniref:AraC family transcriptional regulator n=2 Tax=Rhodococcus rhodnii TaxID=38312 RepID=R7WUR8_9NOCA|nr:AraC family transcriptional regulator [Rhodococcus rhodnii]EOM77874.1 AraC family transcriptional regulator [Rhodococcus rhodnii LMG 5362]TXG88952.1 AraC family transcriptional regulator [Rhodococcus rhodnii]